jgi:hypothetical protein
MPFPTLSSDWERLLAASEENIWRNILDSFRESELLAPNFDVDRLMSAGIRFARSTIPTPLLSRLVVSWIADHPTETRIGIGSAFLDGLWQWSTVAPVIEPDVLREYLKAISSVEIVNERGNVLATLETLRKLVPNTTSAASIDELLAKLRPQGP